MVRACRVCQDDNYASFHDPCYHRYRESHLGFYSIWNSYEVNGARNVVQVYPVIVRACRVCQG